MNDGGPAFPSVTRNELLEAEYHPGMTLRQYYVAKTLQGILANEAEIERFRNAIQNVRPLRNEQRPTVEELVADLAVRCADQALKLEEETRG